MPVPMTTDQANAVYDLLVQHCDAPASGDSWMRDNFVYTQTAGTTDEFRFQGSLGFGGKFWNYDGRWYVSSYREAIERWPAMQQRIDACNEALAALRDELIGGWAMTDRIKLTWSDIWHHHDPSEPLTVYDASGTSWCRRPGGSAWRDALIRQNTNDGDVWTPDDDEAVWVNPPPLPEPPDLTRIEFEHNTDVYAAWRDDASSAQAGWTAGDGGEVWCLFGSTVPRSWAVMWLEFGDSLRTAVRLVPHPDDQANYAKWPTAKMQEAKA